MIVVCLSEHLAACFLQWAGDLPPTCAPRASHTEARSPSLLWALSLEHPRQLGPGAVVPADSSWALTVVGLPSGGAAGSQPVCDRPECRTPGPTLLLVRGRWGEFREAREASLLCVHKARGLACAPRPPAPVQGSHASAAEPPTDAGFGGWQLLPVNQDHAVQG